MPKRKAKELDNGVPAEEPRRSSRRVSLPATKEEAPKTMNSVPKKPKKVQKPSTDESTVGNVKEGDNEELKVPKPTKTNPTPSKTANPDIPSGRQYWLMKAEPESRIEKGHDIKFSIDDLASKTVPEPWDGIRNYQARNNLRAMKKGDLAFFYHSSCKVPAIVGIMEIVQENTPDLSAHNPDTPYYDPSSPADNPKWSVVHVEFRQKLKTPITLKELKEWQGEKGHPLEEMHVLTAARLSVSKVSEDEWKFLLAEMEKRGDVVEQ